MHEDVSSTIAYQWQRKQEKVWGALKKHIKLIRLLLAIKMFEKFEKYML